MLRFTVHSSWIEIAATDLQQQPLDAKHVRLTMQHPATLPFSLMWRNRNH